VQANTAFPEDALIIVYSSLDDLSFRSSMGAIDKQNYNTVTGRYELLIKPIKQMLFVGKIGFLELKINTLNPNVKDVFYFKVEEKKIALINQTVSGKLTINTNPTGANISLNGISITNKTPFTGNLNPGPTSVQLSKTKYQTFDTLMNIESSINEVLTVNLKPSTLWLNIKSNPSSAKIEFDGKIIGETPLSKELDLSDKSKQGERLLKLSLTDYAAVNQTIQLYPSIDPLVINVDLKKLDGGYKIESTPEGAEVFIDGEYKGHTPLQGSLPIGTYSVELKMDEYLPSSKKQIVVNAQSTTNFKENLILKKQTIENLGGEFEEGYLVKDASGNSYKTIKIGDQIWMAENLKTNRYSNGDKIPSCQDDSKWANLEKGAWCNSENLVQNDMIYGKLYNWYAISDVRNVCPIGWHVPSNRDWGILTHYLGGVIVAGNKMKSSDTSNWLSPNYSATNKSGFSFFPGRRSKFGKFEEIGRYGYWWSSSDRDNFDAYANFLYCCDDYALIDSHKKREGLSVRCLMNNSINSSESRLSNIGVGGEVLYSKNSNIIDEIPEFSGGPNKLYEYLGKNIKYPSMARENDITGTVFITFFVEENGGISEVKKLRGIGGGCDEEALRVVKAMPSWKPGRQNGMPVRVQYTLPIKFTLR
jgi:TonB family protein